MKVNRLLNILLLPSLAFMAACTQEELGNDNAVATLFAGIEQQAATKTSLSGPTSGIYKTIWSENDAIGVFVGESEASEFKLKKGDGTTKGEFQGVFKDLNGMSMSKTAVYPYSIIKGKSGSTINVSLPAEQTYKEGNIAEEAYPMVAVTSGSELNFKNLCSVLKISMTGNLTVNYILFSANNNKIKISGDAVINANSESPDLVISGEGNSYVKLTCSGVSLSSYATEFYIVVPAQKYTGGFSLIIDTDKGKVQKTIETDVTLKRSELYRITPFECKIDESNHNIIFEDVNFKAYIVDRFDATGDGEINYGEALKIVFIEVNTDNIHSLAGIEHMPNLRTLRCSGSRNVDLSSHKLFESVGSLKELNISSNLKLESLDISHNQITSINFSMNSKLTYLDCSGNNLSTLDVSNNSNLTYIHCGMNNLSTLDVSKNLNLTDLKCFRNYLTALDVSNNSSLTYLACNHNNILELDVSRNLNLRDLSCDYNSLSQLDVSKNSKLRDLACSSNDLSTLDVSKNSNLDRLDCSYNKLTSLDISKNLLLTNIRCEGIGLSSLDISNNRILTSLNCAFNNLSSLNVSKNTNLAGLHCGWNQLLSIDLKSCPKLEYLDCSYNQIKNLQINCCPKIINLNIRNNLIESLDISALTTLEELNCIVNPLKTLYIYSGQIDGLKDKNIPSTTKFIVGSEPGEDEVFSVTPTLFDIDGNEQDITMTVTANMEYSIDSQPEWISKKSENSGTYTFTVGANTTSSARSGEIIFKNVNNSLLTVTVKQGIQTYTSSDYSQDGKVTKIHSATVGKGIDVVFVGDAFADKDQELFNKYVELGKEAFFTEEPFKSTKDRFNIYRIGSVSKNGIITQEGGDTKFSAEFGQGTNISGDDKSVFRFVQEHMPSVDLTKTIIFVIINKAKYAGTCWMYSNNQAICYVPLCRDENDYAQTLRHEGCGHGFGKLADEYFYTSQGRIPENEIIALKEWKEISYGFYENVDLTSDPEKITWSKFISDSRYSGKVGVYEGGYTYVYGVYRPTDYSIMRHNTGGFNAPSREAIYKKIMKFSEGDAWTYDYETFVAFDAPARSAEAVTRAAAQSAAVDEANFIPLAPPVMVMVDE